MIKPRVIKQIDRSLKGGEERVEEKGKEGYEVLVRRVVRNGNKVVRNEFISKDIYISKATIIKFNPQK